MLKNDHRLLVCLSVLVILTVLSACSPKSERTKLNVIRKVADQIAGYSLPENYSEQFAVDLMGYQMVSLEGPTPNCHIYLVQAPKDVHVDADTLEAQARSMEGEKGGNDLRRLRVVEERSVTLRGEDALLQVSEGINSEDQPYRVGTALFTGRNGPALVSIASPVDLWDWDLANQFLESLE